MSASDSYDYISYFAGRDPPTASSRSPEYYDSIFTESLMLPPPTDSRADTIAHIVVIGLMTFVVVQLSWLSLITLARMGFS